VLSVTAEAAGAIETLVADRESGGLRICPAPGHRTDGRYELRLALTEHPAAGDEVVAGRGWPVFVEQRLISLLRTRPLTSLMLAATVGTRSRSFPDRRRRGARVAQKRSFRCVATGDFGTSVARHAWWDLPEPLSPNLPESSRAHCRRNEAPAGRRQVRCRP
jgi:hypothetical protein